MRILHTSDWHLGKSFQNEIDLIDDQRRFGEWLVDQVRDRKVDVVVIAGDLFQRADPSQAASSLYWEILRGLHETGCKVVGISGNHDSAERIGGPEPLLTQQGLTLRGDVGRLAEPVIIEDEHGPVQFLPLPYLQPYIAGHELGVPEGSRTHESVLGAAIEQIRQGVAHPRTVLIAHAFVRDCATSESELELVGGASEVPPSLFEGFTYVALGHLHTFQPVVESNIYYSGSPLPYSFSETAPKRVILIDLDADGVASIEEVPCNVGRPSKILTASLDDLLTNSAHSEYENHFVLAKLTDSVRTFDARDRLEARFPHLVRIEWIGLSEILHERADAKATDAERIEKFLRTTLGDEFSNEHLQLVLDEYAAVVVEGQVG